MTAELYEMIQAQREAAEREQYLRERPWERHGIVVAGTNPNVPILQAQAESEARLNDPRFFGYQYGNLNPDTPANINADYRMEVGLPPVVPAPVRVSEPKVMNVAGTAIRVNPDGTVTELYKPTPPPQYNTITEIIPATEAKEEVPGVPPRSGIFGLFSRPEKLPTPAVPATPAMRITRKVPVGADIQPAGSSSAPSETRKFGSETAAREAGMKSGDVVYLVGVGKVRLK